MGCANMFCSESFNLIHIRWNTVSARIIGILDDNKPNTCRGGYFELKRMMTMYSFVLIQLNDSSESLPVMSNKDWSHLKKDVGHASMEASILSPFIIP